MSTTVILTNQANFGQAGMKRRQPIIPNSIFGMALFVVAEVMFFTALISAYLIIRASVGAWVPQPGIRLPIYATAFNTGVLFMSGISLYIAGKKFKTSLDASKTWVLRSLLLGLFFLIFQGYEWINLIRFGMTMTTSLFGATFYLLIGAHGVHATGAALGLVWLYRKHQLGTVRLDQIQAMQILWFFVVGVWPVLYGLVYF